MAGSPGSGLPPPVLFFSASFLLSFLLALSTSGPYPGATLSSRGHLAMSGDVFLLSQLREVATGVDSDAAKHPTVHTAAPH